MWLFALPWSLRGGTPPSWKRGCQFCHRMRECVFLREAGFEVRTTSGVKAERRNANFSPASASNQFLKLCFGCCHVRESETKQAAVRFGFLIQGWLHRSIFRPYTSQDNLAFVLSALQLCNDVMLS